MKYCSAVLAGLILVGCADGSATGLSREGRSASVVEEETPPEGEYLAAEILTARALTYLNYRAPFNQADVDALGEFMFRGNRAKMTLYGSGKYHRTATIELVPKTHEFSRYDQNIQIVQQGNSKLVNFFCGLKFTAGAQFRATPYADLYMYTFGVKDEFKEGETRTAGPDCVSPSVTMCSSPIAVAAGAQTTCSASYEAGSGGVQEARWLVDGGVHSDASQTSPALFTGYIASGAHTLTLQITNKAGYANTGAVQVNVAGAPAPPPPPPGGGESTSGQWTQTNTSTSTWCWFENINGYWYNTGKCWEV